MTLKEKFNNVEIMFENQIGSLKYDELYQASNQCEKIADEFAIEFAKWCFNVVSEKKHKGIDTTKELLEIFKKETGL